MNEENKQDKHPKVFLSYSWTSKDFAQKLVTRLIENGIDTIFDECDLKAGNDKYEFMESMVSDPTMDFVLMLCDKSYKEKADSRTGGVGDETVIISSEVYGKSKQEKFLPIIIECDTNGTPYKPIFINSRIHFDFSNNENYEDEYEKLLRHLYNEPIYRKPQLGKKPEWLKESSVNVSLLDSAINQIQSNNERKRTSIISQYPQKFIETAKKYTIDITDNDTNVLGKKIISKIEEMKPLRDTYLKFLNELITSEDSVSAFVHNFFTAIYNSLLIVDSSNDSIQTSCSTIFYEHYMFIIWECFVCTILYLKEYEKFEDIHTILTHTYFLYNPLQTKGYISPCNFNAFHFQFEFLDGIFKKNSDRYSITADIVIKRNFEPYVNKESFAETDIFLTQMSFALDISNSDFHWFARTYLYAKNFTSLWIKLCSKSMCEKLLPLFGVKTIEDMKKIIETNYVNSDYRFNGAWESIPPICVGNKKYPFASLP